MSAPAPADLSLARFEQLDRRVDEAEGDGIMARWEFGRELLREVVGKQLPAGRLDEVAAAIGKSRAEISFRLAFAKRYTTKDEVSNAVRNFGSWHGFCTNTVKTLGSSASNEWYTPARYVELARKVLGKIDLDPASCAEAQETVRAARWFSEADDGLSKTWRGRLWANPPYGRACGGFVDKLRAEHDAGNVTAAVLLVSAYSTETEWFQPLFHQLICFPDHRLRFAGPGGAAGGSPTFGSALVYFGDETDRFVDVFRVLGAITPPRIDGTRPGAGS